MCIDFDRLHLLLPLDGGADAGGGGVDRPSGPNSSRSLVPPAASASRGSSSRGEGAAQQEVAQGQVHAECNASSVSSSAAGILASQARPEENAGRKHLSAAAFP